MDREKVIKGLEEAETMLKQAVDRGGEMYVYTAFKCYNHVSDALSMLKEQESKPPKITENAYGVKFYFCPRCSRPIIKSSAIGKPRHCEDCGQAVKWE